MIWDDLQFWDSGEWQALEEKLDDLDKKHIPYNPKRQDIFASLDAVRFDDVKVCIVGQDPYPQAEFATGIAFSIPSQSKTYPPTLINILKEWKEDLGYSYWPDGDLSPWCRQGVLLFNVIPTCYTGEPASHRDWYEWDFLTKEIVFELSKKGNIVFITLGGIARIKTEEYIDEEKNILISYSHPSPLGAKKGSSPFLGSRLFSTINAKLVEFKQKPIDWRLD